MKMKKLPMAHYEEQRKAQRLFDQGKVSGSSGVTVADVTGRDENGMPLRPKTYPLAKGWPSSQKRRDLFDKHGRLRHRSVGV